MDGSASASGGKDEDQVVPRWQGGELLLKVLCYIHLQIVDTGVLEDVEGLVGGRLGLFCKSQVFGFPG